MSTESNIPDLEERFLAPEGWRWHDFKSGGYKVRFGTATPKDKTPIATVVILPGLGEFCEKYFETARDLLAKGMAVWVIDWPGQGKSQRYLDDPNKRHSVGFQIEINALHDLYWEYIHHASMHPKVGRIPCVMLAHSMGANIGLRYLYQHPDTFKCAVFSAPMFGMYAFRHIPKLMAAALTGIGSVLMGERYAPGQKTWQTTQPLFDNSKLSNDPQRSDIHHAWQEADPTLRLGGVTWQWLYEAVKSCIRISNYSFLGAQRIPFTAILAGKEEIVHNAAAHRIIDRCAHSRSITLPEAKHELLIEKDDIRNQVLDIFYHVVKEYITDAAAPLKKDQENGTVKQ